MTTAVVPYQFPIDGLEKSHKDFQKQLFIENRNNVLSELRFHSGLPEVVSQLNQETVYKLVSAPKGAKMYTKAGKVKGVFYRDGKIVEHARFKAIRPSLVKAATAVGSQVLLISIAIQLDKIEKKIERIISEFHNDRIAEIISGVQQFEQAMWVKDTERQSRMIEHAAQTLNTGLEKTLRSLKLEIEALPDTRISFWDNWFGSKTEDAEKRMQQALESFFASLLGIRTLNECYAALHEPVAAEKVLHQRLEDLTQCGIQAAAEKSRLVPVSKDLLPEEPWKQFLDYEATAMADLQRSGAYMPENVKVIEVEFKPKELREVQHANV
jgi:hypothetical protein